MSSIVLDISSDSEDDLPLTQSDPSPLPPSSHSALSPSSSVISISDDSDFEQSSCRAPPRSSSPLFLDDDADFEFSSFNPLPKFPSPEPSFIPDLDSDDDLPSMHDVAKSYYHSAAKGVLKRTLSTTSLSTEGGLLEEGPSSSQSSPSKRSRISSQSECPGWEGDDEVFPVKLPKRARGGKRLIPEEKVAKVQAATEAKAEKARIRHEKSDTMKRQNVEAKVAKAAYTAVNTLRRRTQALADMEIVFSSGLLEKHPDVTKGFKLFLTDRGATMRKATREISLFDDHMTVRWRRHIGAKYNAVDRDWKPCDKYVEDEKMAILWLDADDLLLSLPMLPQIIAQFRQKHDQTKDYRDQTFVLLYGLANNGRAMRSMDEVARILFDTSADLGVKPYKMIERSHLPFCDDTRLRKGTNSSDTWVKIIGQIHCMTASAAQGITKDYPTFRSLLESYQTEERLGCAENLSRNTQVAHKVDGTTAKRMNLGQAMSRRTWTVMRGDDPLELVASNK